MSFSSLYLVLRTIHLVAAAIWVGGMIAFAVVVASLRRADVPRSKLKAAARSVAHLSWTAMAVSILTGIAQIELLHISWSYPRLHQKIAVVASAIAVALLHQIFAKKMNPSVSRATEVMLLVLSVLILAAAVRL